MKRCATVVFLLTLVLGVGIESEPVLASTGGELNIGADPCEYLVDATQGEVIVLSVVHMNHFFNPQGFSQGARFKVVLDPAITMVPVGYSTGGFVGIGDPYTGISFDYNNPTCDMNLPMTILTLSFLAAGTTPPGSEISLQAYPGQSGPQGKTCLNQWVEVDTWSEYVNGGPCVDPGPVPVQQTTWSGIKALFR